MTQKELEEKELHELAWSCLVLLVAEALKTNEGSKKYDRLTSEFERKVDRGELASWRNFYAELSKYATMLAGNFIYFGGVCLAKEDVEVKYAWRLLVENGKLAEPLTASFMEDPSEFADVTKITSPQANSFLFQLYAETSP